MSEEIKKLVEKVKHENLWDLHISRVPPKTKRDFKRLAEDEFCSDFGMTLKWLMDGLIDKDVKIVLAEVEELKQRVFQLENKPEVEEEKEIRMVNGKVLKRGGR